MSTLLQAQTYDQSRTEEFNNSIPEENIFSAPDAFNFHVLKSLPVNLYTGRVKVSIPIYEINYGGINIPISLDYNTQGIKVDDVASSTGLGWNLIAGGSVIKQVKGVDDHQYNRAVNQGTFDPTPDFSFWNDNSPIDAYDSKHYGQAAITGYSWKHPNSTCQRLNDGQPDLYMLQGPGIQNKFSMLHAQDNSNLKFAQKKFRPFFLDQTGVAHDDIYPSIISFNDLGFSDTEDGVRVPPTGVPITNLEPNNCTSGGGQSSSSLFSGPWDWAKHGLYDGGHNTYQSLLGKLRAFDEFTFKNSKGLQYEFGTKDIIERYNVSTSGGSLTSSRMLQDYLNYSADVTTWHLDQIYNPKTGKEISFSYNQYQNANIDFTYSVVSGIPCNANPNTGDYDVKYFSSGEGTGGHRGVSRISGSYSKKTVLNRLSEIQWEAGKVRFVYGINRQDLIGEKALTSVIVEDNHGNVIKEFILEYDYFQAADGCTDASCKRLRLLRVKEKNGTSTELLITSFDYKYDNPLPRRFSYQKDFLGYYNNNTSNQYFYPSTSSDPYNFDNFQDGRYGSGISKVKKPYLWVKEGQGAKTVLPFSPDAPSGYSVEGDFSMEANDYSLSGVLEKITYPTGGYRAFEYETHDFMFETTGSSGTSYSKEVIAGGPRIKTQKIADGEGNIYTSEYEYVTNQQTPVSSGSINTVPVFGYRMASDMTIGHLHPQSGMELTEGAFVGYSRVIERPSDSPGYIEYLFTSPKDFPNTPAVRSGSSSAQQYTINNTALPGKIYKDNDTKRGKLLEQNTYSQTNNLVRSVINNYQYNIMDSYNVSAFANIKKVRGVAMCDREVISESSEMICDRNVLAKTTTTEYYPDNTSIVLTEEYVYDPTYPWLKETKVINDDNQEIKTVFTRLNDVYTSSNSIYQKLYNENRISELIEIEKYVDQVLIGKEKMEYGNFTQSDGNIITRMSQSKMAKASDAYEVKDQYLFYDDCGNIKAYRTQDGKTSILIWGYESQYPILKIENISYSVLNSNFGTSINNLVNYSNSSSYNQNTFIGMLNAFRTSVQNLHAHVNVSSYTFKPLIGITSITNQRGETSYYEYNHRNQLEAIKDLDGNLIKSYKYNFKN